jgi:hypothetical protein
MAWTDKWQIVAAGSKGDTGATGADATAVDTGDWTLGRTYATNDRAGHSKTGYGKSQFRCLQPHESTADDEPLVGENYTSYWEEFVGGGADGVGTGDVVAPGTAPASDDIAGFADITGKLLKSLGSFATCLSTALSALTGSTTTTDGNVDYIPVKESGGWKLKLADDYAKGTIPITIPAQAFSASKTSGAGVPTQYEMSTYDCNVKHVAFGYSKKSYACYLVDPIPEAYDGGKFTAQFVWFSTGTTTNGVRWGIQLAVVGDNESYDRSWGTAIEVTDNATGTAKRRLKSSTTSEITPSGTPAGGKALEIRIYRDPTHADDNLNEIAYLTGVKLFCPINKHSEN